MRPDPEDLRRHYASLSEEGLRDIDRDDLTGIAQQCYDEELARRDLAPSDEGEPELIEDREEPEWLPDAACACSYRVIPGGTSAQDAAEARAALDTAGVPCYIVMEEFEPEPPSQEPAPTRYEYQVMVPGALTLDAASVLDRDIFNVNLENTWTAQFQTLSDDELAAVNPDAICAGLEDRIARLKRAYWAEMVGRGLAEEAD